MRSDAERTPSSVPVVFWLSMRVAAAAAVVVVVLILVSAGIVILNHRG